MKAQDLRLGNYVTQDGDFIKGITTNTIHKFDLNQIELRPIELTEEWLLKMGFTKLKDSFNAFYLELLDNVEIGVINNRFYMQQPTSLTNTTLNIKYVHQLQNLYHALTGEELTIK